MPPSAPLLNGVDSVSGYTVAFAKRTRINGHTPDSKDFFLT